MGVGKVAPFPAHSLAIFSSASLALTKVACALQGSNIGDTPGQVLVRGQECTVDVWGNGDVTCSVEAGGTAVGDFVGLKTADGNIPAWWHVTDANPVSVGHLNACSTASGDCSAVPVLSDVVCQKPDGSEWDKYFSAFTEATDDRYCVYLRSTDVFRATVKVSCCEWRHLFTILECASRCSIRSDENCTRGQSKGRASSRLI